MIRNLHWYNLNTTREYPLADDASGVDHSGTRLPSNIIADLNLRFPYTLGETPYVAAVAVTAGLVSVVLQVASDAGDTTSFQPLAVISLPQPVEPWRQYAVEPQVDGVGGWIVFGEGVSEAYSGRFSVTAGRLCPRAARSYRPLPISSISKVFSSTQLQGIVRLQAESPLELVGETWTVEGVERTVGVLRLVQSADNTDANVFETFAGPCGSRAETGNCGNPIPIEYLNAVQADCHGNLTITFAGCAKLGITADGHGIVIDCGLGLSNACIGDGLPTSDGVLNNEYPNDACDESWYSATQDDGSLPSETFGDESALSAMLEGGGMTWPTWYTFDLGVANEWRIISGTMGFGPDGTFSWQPVLGSSGAYTGQQAAYISTDTDTQGNWIGTYGAEGYAIAGTPVRESFGSGIFSGNVFSASCTGTVNSTYDSAVGTRALQLPPAGSTRTGSYWYNATSFDFDLAFVDTKQHDVSLYFMAYDLVDRTQLVEILDYHSSEVLYSHQLASLQQGVWLHYRLKGGIKIRITCQTGPDAILNAVLLDQHLTYVNRSIGSSYSGLNGTSVPVYHPLADNIALHQLTNGGVAIGRTFTYATVVGQGGTQYRSSFILNYNIQAGSGQADFYFVEFDADAHTLCLGRQTGTTRTVLETLSDTQITTTAVLQAQVTVSNLGGGNTRIAVSAWKLGGHGPVGSVWDGGDAAYSTLTTSLYHDVTGFVDTGLVGFRADYSSARLYWWWSTTFPDIWW